MVWSTSAAVYDNLRASPILYVEVLHSRHLCQIEKLQRRFYSPGQVVCECFNELARLTGDLVVGSSFHSYVLLNQMKLPTRLATRSSTNCQESASDGGILLACQGKLSICTRSNTSPSTRYRCLESRSRGTGRAHRGGYCEGACARISFTMGGPHH